MLSNQVIKISCGLILMILILIFSFSPLFVFGEVLWTQNYGGVEDDVFLDLIQTTDGGFVLAGNTASYGLGSTYAWLMKIDANGEKQWDQTYGGNGWDTTLSLVQTTDGGFVFLGETSYGTEMIEVWLVKTNANGVMQWNQTYEGTVLFMSYRSLVQTTDGGFAFVGRKENQSWLVKTDANGIVQWNQTYEQDTDPYSLIQTTDEGYAFTGGITHKNEINPDVWLVKTDANGVMQWNQSYGGNWSDFAVSIIQTADSGFVLAGRFGYEGTIWDEESSQQVQTFWWDAWLVKTDANGVMQWNQTYGRPYYNDFANSLIQTVDGGFALIGQGEEGSWLMKTNANGIMQKNQTFEGKNGFAAIIQSEEGSLVLAGYTESYGAGKADAWLVRVEDFSLNSTPLNILGVISGLVAFTVVYSRYRQKRQQNSTSIS